MQLGRVIGTVVASVKDPSIEGVPLLIVQPLDRSLRNAGGAVVAIDPLWTAGSGQLVYFVGSREAEQALPGVVESPADHAIVGLVEALEPSGGAPR
jgi:ethanolamine utilization protein EutN